MKVAGLTGGIGSGKSTVAGMFVNLGARLIDADLLARQVVKPGEKAWNDILETFGNKVFQENGELDRDALAQIIFKDPDARRKLNSITHPRIGEEIVRLLDEYRAQDAAVVLIDAALLLESPATDWIKPVIVVTAPEQQKIDRLVQRDGISEEHARERIASQMSDEQRAEKADYVIENSGTIDDLEARVREIWKIIAE